MSDEKDWGKIYEITNEMGEIGHKMYPKMTPNFFTKIFNTGIKQALKVYRCKDWSDIESKELNVRKRIIRSIMNVAQTGFEDAGMYDPEIDSLYAKIDHELERFVS